MLQRALSVGGGGGGVSPLYKSISTSYSGYTDIFDLAQEGIDTGDFLVLMVVAPIETISSTSSSTYDFAIWTLSDGVLTFRRTGYYASMRVNNGKLQANQQYSTADYAYHYYVCPIALT